MVEHFKFLQLDEYINKHLKNNVRSDGRSFKQYRDILINWDSIETANGYAIVKIGNTTSISGITYEEKEILLPKNFDLNNETPSYTDLIDLKSLVNLDVKFQPYCTYNFKLNQKDYESKESILLTKHVQDILNKSKIFNNDQLIKIKNNKIIYYKVFIEILIINYDGNIFDSIILALVCSIMTFKLNGKPLKIDNYPISTTYCFLKIQKEATDNSEDVFLIDPNADEEKLCLGEFSFVINSETNDVVFIKKYGGDSVDIEIFNACLLDSVQRANTLKKMLINREKKLST